MAAQTAFRLRRFYEVSDVEQSVNMAVDFAKSLARRRPVVNPDPRQLLTDVVQKVFSKIKGRYPEAFFTFGIGQNPEFWQIDLYTNEEELMPIWDLVEDIILEAEDHNEGLTLAIIPLRIEDWEE